MSDWVIDFQLRKGLNPTLAEMDGGPPQLEHSTGRWPVSKPRCGRCDRLSPPAIF